MSSMIKISTAECFTHGRIAREIHSFARGYPLSHPWEIKKTTFHLSLVCGLFIPTISGIENVLGFSPITPLQSVDDIKIYDQKKDIAMAVQMATAVKNLTYSHIGIGTSAGVGSGGMAIVTDSMTITGTTDVNADLRTSNPELIMHRQDAGVKKTLRMLEKLLNNGFRPNDV